MTEIAAPGLSTYKSSLDKIFRCFKRQPKKIYGKSIN